MSQRGGSVSTVIRLGEHVSTMVCDDGCADVVVAFEAVEALRAQHYLAEGGKMFVNDEEITPVSVNIGNFAMPERVDERLRELGAHLLDAGVIARGLGAPRSTNVVLVGALSTALPFDADLWRDAVRACVPPATVEANLAAFDAGRVWWAGASPDHANPLRSGDVKQSYPIFLPVFSHDSFAARADAWSCPSPRANPTVRERVTSAGARTG